MVKLHIITRNADSVFLHIKSVAISDCNSLHSKLHFLTTFVLANTFPSPFFFGFGTARRRPAWVIEP